MIFINDIDSDLHPRTIASLFADDTAIWVQGDKDKKEIATRMQTGVDKIAAWATKWKMSINVDKTKTMILSTDRSDTSWDPELTLNNAPIVTAKEYKFLGIVVDSNLRFNTHLDNTIRKGTKRVNIIKCLAGKDWGQNLESQRKFFLTYVRHCLEYASPSWWSWISATSRQKLERVQNSALRSIAGLYQKCPIDFLQLECNIEPLATRMDKIDLIQQDKYNRLPDNDHRRDLLNPEAPNRLKTREGWSHAVMSHTPQETTAEEREQTTIPPWEHLSNLTIDMVELEKPKAEYSSSELKEKALLKITSIPADCIVYTDGSTDSNQENGGAGIYAEDNNNNVLLEQSEPAGRLCSSCAALYHGK